MCECIYIYIYIYVYILYLIRLHFIVDEMFRMEFQIIFHLN